MAQLTVGLSSDTLTGLTRYTRCKQKIINFKMDQQVSNEVSIYKDPNLILCMRRYPLAELKTQLCLKYIFIFAKKKLHNAFKNTRAPYGMYSVDNCYIHLSGTHKKMHMISHSIPWNPNDAHVKVLKCSKKHPHHHITTISVNSRHKTCLHAVNTNIKIWQITLFLGTFLS